MEETGITVIITVMTDGTRDAPMILVMIENVSIETESMIDVDPTTEEDDPDPQTAEGEGEEEQHITGNLSSFTIFDVNLFAEDQPAADPGHLLNVLLTETARGHLLRAILPTTMVLTGCTESNIMGWGKEY